jgi:tetratricopeptide (TPR) repeat protein
VLGERPLHSHAASTALTEHRTSIRFVHEGVMDDGLAELREHAAWHGRKGSYGSDAVRLNERILELDPTDVTALLRLIRCHEEADEWLSVHAGYTRLLDLGVGDEARIQEKLAETNERAAERAEAHRQAEARARERRAREEESRRQLDEEVRAIDSFRDSLALGSAARKAGNHELAFAYHGRAIELARTTGDKRAALTSKAATLRYADRPREAIATLRSSIKLDPSRERNKASYTTLVAALCDVRELDEARREGEALMQVNEDDSWVLRAVGRVFKNLSERDQDAVLLARAESCYRRAAELEPRDRNIVAELRSLIAAYDNLALQLGKPDLANEARQLERHVAQLQPRLPDAGST